MTDSSYVREGCQAVMRFVLPPVYQIEQNNLAFDAKLGDAHEERAEKVLGGRISRSQERNGSAADGRIRTPYNIPAEVRGKSTHDV